MKNDGTYFLQFQLSTKKTERHYPPQVYPFEWNSMEFFTHRLAKAFENHVTYSVYFWGVSHKETGFLLPVEATSRASAKKIALEKLETIGLDKVKAEIEKAKEMQK